MAVPDPTITVATLNIQGQSGINEVKQKQIEDFIKFNKIDILHLQEIEVTSRTFEKCRLISSRYNIIQKIITL